MALVDVLELLPADHADYNELVRILQDTLGALKNYQDAETGVWYQVVNLAERKGNYLEASASSMIVYALGKGIRLGVLDDSWSEMLDRGYAGLITEFVLVTKEGLVNLNKNCQVAGLGGADKRDGTYAYYISEPIITNDQKGLGAFLQACAEYEQLRAGSGASGQRRFPCCSIILPITAHSGTAESSRHPRLMRRLQQQVKPEAGRYMFRPDVFLAVPLF